MPGAFAQPMSDFRCCAARMHCPPIRSEPSKARDWVRSLIFIYARRVVEGIGAGLIGSRPFPWPEEGVAAVARPAVRLATAAISCLHLYRSTVIGLVNAKTVATWLCG